MFEDGLEAAVDVVAQSEDKRILLKNTHISNAQDIETEKVIASFDKSIATQLEELKVEDEAKGLISTEQAMTIGYTPSATPGQYGSFSGIGYHSPEASAEIKLLDKLHKDQPEFMAQFAPEYKPLEAGQVVDDATSPYADEPFRKGILDQLKYLEQKQLVDTQRANSYIKRGIDPETAYSMAQAVTGDNSIEVPEHSADAKSHKAASEGNWGQAMWEGIKGNWMGLVGGAIGGAGYGLFKSGAFGLKTAAPYLISKAGVASLSSGLAAELMATPLVNKIDRELYDHPWLNLGAQIALGGTGIAKAEDALGAIMKSKDLNQKFLETVVAKGVQREVSNIFRRTSDPSTLNRVRAGVTEAVFGSAPLKSAAEERKFLEAIIGRKGTGDTQTEVFKDVQSELQSTILARMEGMDMTPGSKSYTRILENRMAKLSKAANEVKEGYAKNGVPDPRVTVDMQPEIMRYKALGVKLKARLDLEKSKSAGFRRYKSLIRQISNELTDVNHLTSEAADALQAEMKASANTAWDEAAVAADEVVSTEASLQRVIKTVGTSDPNEARNLTEGSKLFKAQKAAEDAKDMARVTEDNANFMDQKAWEKALENDAKVRQQESGGELIDDEIFSPVQAKLNKQLKTAVEVAPRLLKDNSKAVKESALAYVESSNMPPAQQTEAFDSIVELANRLLYVLGSPGTSNKAKEEAVKQLKEVNIL